MMNELTQARLHELFDYDQSTGELIWRVSHNNAKAGTVAGHLHSSGYCLIGVDGRQYRRARLVLLYVDNIFLHEDEQADHINRIRHDDRRSNLRPSDQIRNARNHGIRVDNTSGATGVCWVERRGKWKAAIAVDGEDVHIGYFRSFEAAVAAYERHRRIYFGAESCA
jgi:hypothetical protein